MKLTKQQMTPTKIFLDWHGPQTQKYLHLSQILGFCKNFFVVVMFPYANRELVFPCRFMTKWVSILN